MIILESKVVVGHLGVNEGYVSGYFLTIHDLVQLLSDYERDKQTDNMIGLDTLSVSYIERWLKNHNRIIKKD